MKKVVLLFAAAIAIVACKPAQQEVGENGEKEKEVINEKPSTEVSALKLANQMIKYGYEQQSALSLISGAQILMETDFEEMDEKKDGPAVSENETKDGMDIPTDIDALLADAKEMAEGDENLLAVISSLGEMSDDSHRGAVGGPKRTVDRVRENSTDVYTINFVAGQLAEVALSGDGDTDLDLYVYDSNGNLIDKDDDYSDDCYVSWCPRWTGKFVIKVVNLGPLWNKYILVTN